MQITQEKKIKEKIKKSKEKKEFFFEKISKNKEFFTTFVTEI